jgi:hypothetical protein
LLGSGKPCPRPRPGGGRCRSRRCPSCGLIWAGDVRVKLRTNIQAFGQPVTLITVTAPGQHGVKYWHRQPNGRWVDVADWRAHKLPWDETGRRVERAAAFRWNRSAPARWRALHRAASQAARRKHGRAFVLVAREWEYQRRGALHMHAVVGMATPRQRSAAHYYAAKLDEMRERYGFGFVDRGRKLTAGGMRTLPFIAPERAANYLAKYLAPMEGGKIALSETAKRPDVPPHVLHVSRELTMATGVTMMSLRRRRLAWMLRVDAKTGETWDSIAARGFAGDVAAMEHLRSLLPTPET